MKGFSNLINTANKLHSILYSYIFQPLIKTIIKSSLAISYSQRQCFILEKAQRKTVTVTATQLHSLSTYPVVAANRSCNLVCLVHGLKRVPCPIPQPPRVLCGTVFLGRSGPEAVRLLL